MSHCATCTCPQDPEVVVHITQPVGFDPSKLADKLRYDQQRKKGTATS